MHLSEVNRFASDVDIPRGCVEEPHPGLRLAHVRH